MFILVSNIILVSVLLLTLWWLNIANTTFLALLLGSILICNALHFLQQLQENKRIAKILSRLKEFNKGVLAQNFDDIEGGKIGDMCSEIHKITQNTRHLVGELSIASE